jgi:flagellar motor switch protein FliM
MVSSRADTRAVTSADPSTRRSGPRPFDFRRPNKLNRDHLRHLEIVFETFARQCSTVLSSTLRSVARMDLVSIEQLTYDEYVDMTPNPSHLVVLDMAPLSGPSLMALPLPVAYTFVDLLLGGHGRGATPTRPLTEIEVSLVHSLVRRQLDELKYAFNSLVGLEISIKRHESNPQFAQIAAPSDMTVVTCFELTLEEVTEIVTVCIPYPVLQPVLEDVTQYATRQATEPAEARRIEDMLEDTLHGVAVEVAMRMPPVAMTPAEILALGPGDIIGFGLASTEPLRLDVEDRPTYLIRPARQGKRLAGQIVSILTEPLKEVR